MIIIRNNIIPFKGFDAINILGIIFVRKEYWDTYGEYIKRCLLNHERIHTKQMLELLVIGFYIAYLVEWIFKGYDKVSFEKEAYLNEENFEYLKTRKHYAQWK